MVYMYHSFLIHSSADGHLGCFYVLAMINSAKIWNASQICMSSLCRGHANLLCIVPILVYVLPKQARNWCFWTVMLEKTLMSLLYCKEIQPVNPKSNQSWIFIGKTDAETKAPILWPPDAKNWLFGKEPDARKDWRQEKGRTEDEIVEWLTHSTHSSLSQWTWVWASSRSLWWTGKSAVLQPMVFQNVGHTWATELNQVEVMVVLWLLLLLLHQPGDRLYYGCCASQVEIKYVFSSSSYSHLLSAS